MPDIKPINSPVAMAQCHAESTPSWSAQAASITRGRSAMPESRYTRLMTADCKMTVNRITGTATRLRIVYRSGRRDRDQGSNIHRLKIDDHEHDFQPVEIHNRLNCGLLEQIEIPRSHIDNLSDDQVWRIPPAQS